MLATLSVLASVLGIATAVNLSLTFAVIRRLREMEAGQGGAAAEKLPPTGFPVAEFTAETVSGRSLSRADIAGGEALVGFVMVGCGPCAQLIDSLTGGADTGVADPLFFVIGDPSSAEAQGIAGKLSPVGDVALVADVPALTAAFGGVRSYPTLIRLRDGVIVQAGHNLDGVRAPTAARPAPAGGRG
ncbi:hypothetical protein OG455_34245 [Kitasatospora sp. NBC_01287]|uniref:hypothetical protein n=1 Tax=Kitasatospora sp. NBC_01287 TaxID=2903573 RepID=UPI002254FDE4|nr:hypothetical protein [Kitasatospora sp. NBC_01287]MCX4750515.1 hypothetical protein [Kitasatospora sp. NBC_01287]